MGTAASLQKELALFNSQEPAWIENGLDGQWVAITGDSIIGFFSKFEEGLNAGQSVCGDKQFLLRRIVRNRRPEVIQRVGWLGNGAGI